MRGKKRDLNHQEIVDALEKFGVAVLDLANVGRGCPDLLALYRHRTFFVEVKNPQTTYGKRGLNPLQQKLADRGFPVFVIKSIEDVPAILSKVVETITPQMPGVAR